MKERSLVFFTLAMQAAAGLFIITGLLYQALAHWGSSSMASILTRLNCSLVIALAMMGLLASFAHLEVPTNAWRALSNLRHSWLSREILCAGLFILLSILFLREHVVSHDTCVQKWLGWGTSASGIGLVYCMARVYMLPTVPEWNTKATLAAFGCTALLAGGALAALGFTIMSTYVRDEGLIAQMIQLKPVTWGLRWLGGGLLALLLVKAARLRFHQDAKTPLKQMQAVFESEAMRADATRLRQLLQWQNRFAWTAMCGAFLMLLPAEPLVIGPTITCAAVLASEWCGRTLFYENRVS